MRRKQFSKLVILFVLALSNLIPHVSLAQGNLEFNQVRLFELEGDTPIPGNFHQIVDSIQFTVPQGKVLKIEFARTNWRSNGISTNIQPHVPPDGTNRRGYIYVNEVMISPAVQSGRPIIGDFPIWLPSGTYKLTLSGAGDNSFSTNWKGMVSAIEFNVSP
ncbi:MAG: hypothetical protein AAFW00_07240 [Bacteroidota bacterium]